MQQFLISIRADIATKNWFGALFMTLAMPDICAALEDGTTNGARYRDWFDRYLKAEYDPTPVLPAAIQLSQAQIDVILAQIGIASDAKDMGRIEELYDMLDGQSPIPLGTTFTAKDCYSFRCKTLHEGLAEGNGGKKIEFSPPPEFGMTMHRCLFNETYIISINIFCEDVCKAVEQWLVDKASDPIIQRRISELMNLKTFHAWR
jgi:hypothetical protein